MTSVSVAGLLQEAPGASLEVRLRDHYLSLGPEIEVAGPLNGFVRLQRTNRGILVRGSIDVPLRRTCARCLDPFVEVERIQIMEEYLPTIDPQHGTPLPSPLEDENVQPIDAHHQIDLAPVLHDEVLLAEPMHALCRVDCRGLCPGCGRHLQSGSCGCEVEELDPRLAPLARLLRPPSG